MGVVAFAAPVDAEDLVVETGREVGLRPVRAGAVASDESSQAAGREVVVDRGVRQRASPAQEVTASELDSWFVANPAKGAVPEAHECPAYTSNTRSRGVSPVSRATGDVGREQVHHRSQPRHHGRVVGSEDRGGVEEVPVVEVMVVELIRPEGGSQPDDTLPLGVRRRSTAWSAPHSLSGPPIARGSW
jgi:hypothetical protein